ncbi:winged helix-turn-helix domain-containing protein [Rhodoluna lacicola]|uniref:winged helix-turn-helix domain-containing protein n=1 Tax=Rhodoluna lacicola TaxID=529884 RepID=UPI0022312540|nr:winged helix-turn-helix domain-containing protein [Rhodoluna lacicola]BDS50957.1 transcriptional regulator [Rhodoluna lacicola]
MTNPKPTGEKSADPAENAPALETEARGFALYVGVDEATAAAAGVSLSELVTALRKTVADLVPSAAAETYAAVALAPKGIGGKPIDVVRTALRDPRALDKLTLAKEKIDPTEPTKGIVIDPSRKKVFADGENADLTYKEFELLKYLIEHEGSTISRREIIDVIWNDGEGEIPNDRTIDVHIRRLRAKIAGYEDIIRTVRGGGYRFDKHPEVIYEI